MYSGIGEAIAAIAVIVVYALLRGRGRGEAAQHMIGALGAGCACIGSVLVWVSHLDISWYAALTVAGGLCCGAGLSLLGILWGSRFSYCDEEHIESTVPLSFVISFVVYFVLLAVKGPLFMVVDAVLPVVSAWIVFRPRCGRNVSADGEAVGALAHVGLRRQFSHLVSLFVLYFLIWFQIALFRVASSPMTYGGRFMHYLVPFSIAAVLAIAAFLTCMRQTRFLNFTFLYRWSVPLMIIGCGLLLIDLGTPSSTARVCGQLHSPCSAFRCACGLWRRSMRGVSVCHRSSCSAVVCCRRAWEFSWRSPFRCRFSMLVRPLLRT